MKRISFSIFVPILLLGGLLLPRPALCGEPASSPATPLPSESGRKWAFCLGIGEFGDARIVDLPRANHDARGLARVLKEHAGFQEVLVFAGDAGRKDPLYPTRKNILAAFRRVAEEIDPQDLVLVSFSGHGITGPSGGSFLVTADTTLEKVESTALPLDTVLAFIRESGARRSLLLLDASRERITVQESRFLQGVYPDRYLKDGVTALFYAARKGCYSHDPDDSDYGLFFGSLIRAVAGEGDREYGGNGDGIVSLTELAAYTREALSAWSMESGKWQIPYTRILARGMEDMAVASAVPAKVAVPTVALRREPAPEERKPDSPGAPERPEPPKELEKEKPFEQPASGAAEVPPADREPARPPVQEVLEDKPLRVAEPAPTMEEITAEKPAEDRSREAAPERPAGAVKEQGPGVEEKREPVTVDSATPAPTPEPEPQKAVEEKPPQAAPEVVEGTAREREPSEEKQAPGGEVPEAASAEGIQTPAPPMPAEKEAGPVTLRREPGVLSPKDVLTMLQTRNFYATCWNYNSEFCNPEGDFENRFEENGDGTVTDAATGLMWQKGGSPRPVTWQDAKLYAENANRDRLGGYSDWRLPTLEELASLMERSWRNHDLFIDPLFEKTQRHCWSMDTRDAGRAWKANFHMGFFLDFPMTAENSVRLVRSLP